MPKCTICGSSDVYQIMRLNGSPLLQAVLYDSEEDVDRQEQIDISFHYCKECHFAFNPDFKADAVVYDTRYNNNQMCSNHYKEYLDALSATLVTSFALTPETRVLEIGCGNAYFLHLLKKRAGLKTAVGYDPAYAGQYDMDAHVVREMFKASSETFDFIVFRHCFESIPNIGEVLGQLRSALAPGGRIFIETVNLDYMLNAQDPTIFCHECHSYYSLKAIGLALERVGLRVTHGLPLFGGQYCGVIAQQSTPPADLTRNLDTVKRHIMRSERPVVWGISGRAVNLLNHLGLDKSIVRYAVDIDPSKQGRYIAFTKQLVISPQQAVEYNPDLVLVMNRNYLAEIQALLPPQTRAMTVDGVIHEPRRA